MAALLHGKKLELDKGVWSNEFGWGYVWGVKSFDNFPIVVRFNYKEKAYKYNKLGIREGETVVSLYFEKSK